MPDDSPNHFRFLDSREFGVLSTEEKLAYLEKAVPKAHEMLRPERLPPDRED